MTNFERIKNTSSVEEMAEIIFRISQSNIWEETAFSDLGFKIMIANWLKSEEDTEKKK